MPKTTKSLTGEGVSGTPPTTTCCCSSSPLIPTPLLLHPLSVSHLIPSLTPCTTEGEQELREAAHFQSLGDLSTTHAVRKYEGSKRRRRSSDGTLLVSLRNCDAGLGLFVAPGSLGAGTGE
ncbi:hypothetical protein CHARACLAT_012211 [Characodon lateralis]|uniref:Uncharacterized protein n=1 Tax=Characodon lateralis TaxID=208331 RepID=A0ABU7EL44_9TELE|nr:hypothetical protein [Characodon lateralis]